MIINELNQQYYQERYALSNTINEIINHLYPNKKHNYKFIPSDPVYDQYSPYDGILLVTDNDVIKKYIIEIKIRETYYDELLLESTKLKKINQYADATFIYVNITPNGSFMFNMNELKGKFEMVCRQFRKNNQTFQYINKVVYMLPVTEGIKLQYKHSYTPITDETKENINNELNELRFFKEFFNIYDFFKR